VTDQEQAAIEGGGRSPSICVTVSIKKPIKTFKPFFQRRLDSDIKLVGGSVEGFPTLLT